MTAPKPGDRVRVQFEGRIDYEYGNGTFDVVPDGSFRVTGVTPQACTVLPKPMRVGDKVRLGEDPEPPVGTVLVDPRGGAYRRLNVGLWTHATTSPGVYDWPEYTGDGEATVVWLPGGAS